MALDASIKTTGGSGGGKTGFGIRCYGFKAAEPEHDPQSGLATGRRMHKPVSIAREVDSASPQLLHACNIGETFSSAPLQFPQTSSSGKANTLELLDGAIIKIEHPPSKNGKRLERLTLSFNGKKLNGGSLHRSGGIERYWWRDNW